MSEKISVLISEEDVDKKVREIAAQISKDYKGKEVHLICVLKGSVFFACELAKRITVPVTLDFMSVSSYGDDTKSSGVVKIIKDLDEPLENKDVLIVEDIIDSGRTLSYLIEILNRQDIILVVKRTTPHHHQPVGIKLSPTNQWKPSCNQQ